MIIYNNYNIYFKYLKFFYVDYASIRLNFFLKRCHFKSVPCSREEVALWIWKYIKTND